MAERTEERDGVALTIDGRRVLARPGELLIAAAERHGIYIPRFCYHPRMSSVGMCRMCIVEVDAGRGPSLQPSCMLECAADMVVETESPVTKKAQDGVLEFLLINHPLDCPVCDKGGECPLQDQTMAYGPGESRFVEQKRNFEKPIPISDLVLLDRERCILCDRCTRFADEVAGDPLISFIDRGGQTQVNTFPDHPFSSYFSGNTVQICPVGALTATSYRFRARPWDLTQAESTCQGCSVGCRIAIQTSRNEVLRYQGVDVDPVNWSWLCDKGRFGHPAVHSPDRLSAPLLRGEDGELGPVRWTEALSAAARAIGDALERGGPERIGVIGGARLTNEDAYAWAKLAKGILGTDNVDCQLADGLPAEVVLGLPRATIDEVCRSGGSVILIAPDLKEELPVLYLRLRHAVREEGVRLIEVSPRATSLTPLAAASLRPRPGAAGELVAALLGDGHAAAGVPGEQVAAAAALLREDRPLHVVFGRASVAEAATATVDAVSAIRTARPDARFLPALRRANVLGALDMGLAPGLLPGRVSLRDAREWYAERWPGTPEEVGKDTREMLEAAAAGELDVLVLLGADLFDVPDRDLVRRALERVGTIVALDLFVTQSAREAHVVFPAAGFAECEGTTTNVEGRVSTLAQSVTSPGTARSDWMIAAELAFRMGHDLGLESPRQIWDEIEQVAPSHAGLTSTILTSALGQDGIVVPVADPAELLAAVPQVVTSEGTIVHLRYRPPTVEPEVAEARAEADEAAVRADAAPDEVTRQEEEAEAVEAQAEAVEAEEAQEEAPPDEPEGEGRPEPGEAPTLERPPLLELDVSPATPAPAVDAYALRLVASRRLYDLGTLVQQAPKLGALAPGTSLAINPYDFDRLGVAEGEYVRITSPRAALTLPVTADAGVPRGVAGLHVNQPGPDVSDLLDASSPVIDIRVETAGEVR